MSKEKGNSPAATTPAKPAESNGAELRNADNPVSYRYVRVAETDFTEENVFQIAAASEFPVERRANKEHARLGIANEGEKFWEVLSHEPADANLSRFNGENRAAFLDEHLDNRHLGFIRQAALSDDKVTRAVVELDAATKLSKTRRKQIRTGSRPNVSIGYQQTRYLGATDLADGRKTHRFAWLGLEVSSVAVPADPTVGLGRSRNQECHCFRCGGIYLRDELTNNDGALTCADCTDAEDPTETETDDQRSMKPTPRALRSLDNIFTRAESGKISFNNLRDWVQCAAREDARFNKDSEGKEQQWVWIADIQVEEKGVQEGKDLDIYTAIIQAADGKYYRVPFTYADSKVTLGVEAETVAPVVNYEPVSRSQTPPVVDSRNLRNAGNAPIDLQPKPVMPKTAAELAAENPEVIAQLRKDTERDVRVSIQTEAQTRSQKIESGKTEIRALADESIKDHGAKVNGKPGEVFYVGEAIRRAEMEAVSKLGEMDVAEVRLDFKRKVSTLVDGARAAKNPLEAAILPDEIASRCSVGRVIRAAMEAAEKGQRSACFMVADGAEAEADKELRHQALQFPGGRTDMGEGVCLPINIRSGIRSNTAIPRLGRDAAAGDFATAGAVIQPDYVFPIIELLRNLPALSRAGMTILSGLQGGRLVLPRQTAATTAQWVAEGAALTAYDQTLDQITLNPHRVGSSQNYGRLALLQSTPDFEAMLMADHMAQIALAIDAGGINGTGGNSQPLGILNYPGIGSVTFAGSAANAFKNAVAMETAVRKANIFEAGSFLTTSAGRGMLMSTAKLLVGATTVAANAVWENETVAGRPGVDSQQIPGDVLVYLVGRHLIMAQWGGISTVIDTLTKADKDQYKVSLNTYVDFGLRHAQAVCRTSDSIAALS